MNKQADLVRELLNVLVSFLSVLLGFSRLFPIQRVGFFQAACVHRVTLPILTYITWALNDTPRRSHLIFRELKCCKPDTLHLALASAKGKDQRSLQPMCTERREREGGLLCHYSVMEIKTNTGLLFTSIH